MERVWTGPIETATIRVYADDQHRAQNLDWRQRFEGTLDYANAVLGPVFGVKLEADYREWKRHEPGATLSDHLAALRTLDAGNGALCVVGLTSSLGLVTATFDQLGVAEMPGRHMVLRGYSDVEERKAFTAAFPDLSSDERENALHTRRIHKTTALLLHEMAHNLGANHDETEDLIMSAGYSHDAAKFSPESRTIVQQHLSQRLGRSTPESTSPTPTLAAAPQQQPARSHAKLTVVISKTGVLINGQAIEHDGQLNGAFSMQAALDSDTEVVIVKERGVPASEITRIVERAKANGLERVTFK